MNKNILTKQIAKKLGWSENQTRYAIEEFAIHRSALGYIYFLKLCTEANNPIDRFWDIYFYLIDSTKHLNKIDIICELLEGDVCFKAMALFNYNDIRKDTNYILDKETYCNDEMYESGDLDDWDEDDFGNYKSFIHWLPPDPDVIHIERRASDREYQTGFWSHYEYQTQLGLYIENNVFHNVLSDRLLDKYVGYILYVDEIELSELFIEVFKRKKLLTFNISRFRFLAIHTDLMNKEDRQEFIKLFKNNVFKANELTQQTYYKYYCLVEILKKRGYEVLESIRMVANEEKAGYSSIKTRYYEKSTESKKNNTSLSDLIKKYGFQNTLEELADRIESKKNSMNK